MSPRVAHHDGRRLLTPGYVRLCIEAESLQTNASEKVGHDQVENARHARCSELTHNLITWVKYAYRNYSSGALLAGIPANDAREATESSTPWKQDAALDQSIVINMVQRDFLGALREFLSTCQDTKGQHFPKSLLVHSDVLFLLRRVPHVKRLDHYVHELMPILCELLLEAVDQTGILMVPGFADEYARTGSPFDRMHTPPSRNMGFLPRFVFTNHTFFRDLNPLTNLIGIGAGAQALFNTSEMNTTGFSTRSVWSKFSAHGTRVLFLGVPSTYMTYLHFLEVQYGAPYMFNKLFLTPIYDNGKLMSESSICPVRYRDTYVRWDFRDFMELCRSEGAIITMPGTQGMVTLADCAAVQTLFEQEFAKNPLFMIGECTKTYGPFQAKLEAGLDGKARPNLHSKKER